MELKNPVTLPRHFLPLYKTVTFFMICAQALFFYATLGNSTNIVSSNLCDNNVKQYSGYIEIAPDNNMFFWFFESRNNPKESPLTLWLNGGPGCSSLEGVLEEVGPCKAIKNGSEIINNVYSWNEISNMLFVDQPIGVGLSYGSRVVNTTEQATEDLYVFLQMFFTRFPEYAALDFHIFGESYTGHYAPSIAKKIVELNNLTQNNTKINLKSVGLGNGWIDPEIQFISDVYFAKYNSYQPLLNTTLIREMGSIFHKCQDMIKKSKSVRDLKDATDQCFQVVTILDDFGVDSFDIRPNATRPNSDYAHFVNNSEVLESIGAGSFIGREFADCIAADTKVYYDFYEAGDIILTYKPHVEYLLENNVRIMLYHGDADYICNWFGGLDVANQLVWKGQTEFNAALVKHWKVDDEWAGQIRSFGQLWFVKVYRSGHEVTFYQPKNSLDLFKRWIDNDPTQCRGMIDVE
ncbi:1723_t:CDS:10, partial [Acaulospora morrowiae]